MGMGMPPGMGGGGRITHAQAAAFVQTPQGRDLIEQLAANPQQFLQMLPPEARNSPEVLAMVQNPAMLRERLRDIVMQSLIMQGGGPGDGGPLVPRDIFDLAMDCMNGAEIPEQYRFEIRFQGPDGQPINPPAGGFGGLAPGAPPAPAAAAGAGQEFVSRDVINAALDACVRNGLISDVPRAGGPTADDARSEAALSDAATAGSAVGSVADVADNMELEETPAAAAEMDVEAPSTSAVAPPAADPPQGMQVDPPEQRFAAQLAQLKEMGFDNEQACLNALEAAGGDVQTALAFLS